MSGAAWLRAGMAAGAVVGAALLGRRAIDKQIRRRMSAATEEAIKLAEHELDRSVRSVMRERVTLFLRTMAWKFLLLGIVCGAYALDLLTLMGLRISVLILGLGFLAYDLRQVLPQLLPAIRYARHHSFRARAMVTDAVAASAFEKAYEEASTRLGENKGKHWIALSSFNPHDLSNEIAQAVAEVARHASYDKVKPRALLFLAFTITLSILYTGIAWLAVRL